MKKPYRFLLAQPLWRLTLLALTSALVSSEILGRLALWLVPSWSVGSDSTFESLSLAILLAVLIGPLLETIIFQHSAHLFLRRICRLRVVHVCLISSVAFGLFHFYNPIAIVSATITGFHFILYYTIVSQKRLYPIWATSLLHALFNGVVLMLEHSKYIVAAP